MPHELRKEGELVDAAGLAAELGLPTAEICVLADRGLIPCRRAPGGRLFFDPEEAVAALSRRREHLRACGTWALGPA